MLKMAHVLRIDRLDPSAGVLPVLHSKVMLRVVVGARSVLMFLMSTVRAVILILINVVRVVVVCCGGVFNSRASLILILFYLIFQIQIK